MYAFPRGPLPSHSRGLAGVFTHSRDAVSARSRATVVLEQSKVTLKNVTLFWLRKAPPNTKPASENANWKAFCARGTLD